MNDLMNYQAIFNNIKIDPKVVFDIGASDGIISRQIFKYKPGIQEFHLFDPRECIPEEPNNFNHTWHRPYLSDSEKEVEFYYTEKEDQNGAGNSYYKEVTEYYKDARSKKVKTTTLDKYAKENNLPYPDLIKLDTQGSEIDILKGGKEYLSHAQLVIIEVPVMQYNHGAPKFDEYISFMLENEFVPYSTLRHHFWNDKHDNWGLVQLDMAFVKLKEDPTYFVNTFKS